MNFAQLARSVRDHARHLLAHPLAQYLPASWHGADGKAKGKAPVPAAPGSKVPVDARGLLARLPGASLSFLAIAGLTKAKAAEPAPAPPPAPVRPKPKVVPSAPADDDDDDDDPDEMRDASPVAHARRRERARCAAIITSPAGLLHPALARKLALATRMPRAEALALLEAQPAPFDFAAASAARTARNPRIGAGMPEGRNPAAAAAASMDRAFARASGRQPS